MHRFRGRLTALTVILSVIGITLAPLALAETPWLEDYSYRKLITVGGSAGAGTGYVVFVKAYYASGTDGFEILAGGHNGINATKIYLAGNVETDFDDVRFTETDGTTELDYFRDSYTVSVSALFAVEVSGDLETEQSLYIYFGDAGQATESDAAATFRRVISSGIALSLPMNEGAGNCVDYSGNNLTGVLTGGVSWIAGKYNNALRFDGVNGLVTITDPGVGSPLDISPNLSINYWFIDTATELPCVEKSLSYYSYYDGNTAIIGRCYSDAAQHVGKYTVAKTGAWHMATYTYQKDGSQTMALDAGARATEAVTSVIDANNNNLLIGKVFGAFRVGSLGFLLIFNYQLSTDEEDDLYAYYPQCSSANLGSLYLRSYVNPEPQPGNVGDLEVNNRYASTSYVWMAVLLVVGFVFMGFMLLRRGN